MTAPTWLTDLVDEHQLGGTLSETKYECAAEGCRWVGDYLDHPAHLAGVIAAELRARLESEAVRSATRASWPGVEAGSYVDRGLTAALAAVADELLGGSDAD